MNGELRRRLMDLKKRDLETRTRLLEKGVLFDGYHPEMEAVHCENALQLEQILDAHGWPGVSLVGEDGEEAAWMIAQHAISLPGLQKKSLACIKEAVSGGEAPAWHRAFLEDRILANQQKPQLCGAIWEWDENGLLSAHVDDPKKADERRRKIGLPPLKESMKKYRSQAAAEGAKGPENYEDYAKQRREWAVRVGWISEA